MGNDYYRHLNKMPYNYPHEEMTKSIRMNLSYNFKEAREFEEWSDFNIYVQKKTFPVHRFILVQRCPFFRDFFEDPTNKETEELRYDEKNHTIINKIIDWIYSGKIRVEFDEYEEILQEARFFQLYSLEKKLLESSLSKEENMDKVSQIKNARTISCQFFEYIGSDFEDCVNSENYSDVQFTVEGRNIYAHKVILCCRSQFFRSLFLLGFRESREDEIPISEISYISFLSLITFLYTGSVNYYKIKQMVELLAVADFYCIDDFKREIEIVFRDHLTQENALDVFMYAKYLNSNWLKLATKNYILSEYKYFLQKFSNDPNPDWKDELLPLLIEKSKNPNQKQTFFF
ncbi:hypothetical protein M0811_04380 [Anaeramoeba ignava]|uniref:BTB domain-containing protein n=1 Tax=Anaeramoeba ignava TaxID=1746090 RepID=A0A9Q0RGP9_ANAIG|nr:hypothetical protein M0811_04380 [Anaeramoeba ignava]